MIQLHISNFTSLTFIPQKKKNHLKHFFFLFFSELFLKVGSHFYEESDCIPNIFLTTDHQRVFMMQLRCSKIINRENYPFL